MARESIDVQLTDKEIVLLMTICELMGKGVSERDVDLARLNSVREINRERRTQDDLSAQV
jgi:hypothetical protein